MSDVLTVELPEKVSQAVARLARERGMTSAEFVAMAAADRVGAFEETATYFAQRAARARPGAFEKVFGPDRTGGEPPREGDEID